MVRRFHRDKRDVNEQPIVDTLKRIGASVHRLKGPAGVPDLLVGFQGQTYLMEVKDPESAKAGGRQYAASRRGGLDPDQYEFHSAWRGGPCIVVWTPGEALAALGVAV